jgi:DNA helicase-2/ATP-dependent DNA helicase PcrA
MNLNKEQESIISNIFGAYLINAPVGTGKTTILTERIIKAIKFGLRHDEILALTFTNRAAEEIRSRIKEKINDKNDFDSLTISTFHSFCAYFVRSEAKKIGIPTDFLIFDEEEQLELTKKILEENGKFYIEKPRDILNILDTFYKYRLSTLQVEIGHNVVIKKIDPEIITLGEEYLKRMYSQNALDFNELVLIVLKSLFQDKEINERWSERFKFIQLDEFQDTHISEYLIIKELAKKHKNISLIGDIDQTIYSFRDSRPVFIAKLFKNHFEPVKEFSLSTNYRSNPELIKAFLSVLSKMENAQTKKLNSLENKDNSKEKTINLFKGYNFKEEVLWVIDNIKKIKSTNSKAKIAVLSRANYLLNKSADIFSENNISFLTVDQYDFFRRQEIKDLFSYLKILLNKSDLSSAKRIIDRPTKNIGEKTIENIQKSGSACGLNLADFLDFKNYNFNEPFEELIKEIETGRLIVFDTETTGTNPIKDDVIQIYAREIIKGKLGKEFHFYLKTNKKVNSSYFVHKISDEFLEKEGKNPKEVLLNLKKFIGESIVCGHNVLFDINMVTENSRRYNIDFQFKNYYDTLSLSRKFLSLSNYKLSNIAKNLKFKGATHSADDDVLATIDLLFYLCKKLKKTKKEREVLWNKYKTKFINLSSNIKNWEKEISKKRPDELISFLWKESGLKDFYKKDKNFKKREGSFLTLKTFFENKDDFDLSNREALQNLIHYSSLIKNIDFLGLENGKIPIVTIHQVKGLEFDYIFLVGLNEGVFPFFKTENYEEEERLFYVALTRAKRKVFLSYSEFNDYNNPIAKSRLISMINNDFINFI